MKDQTQHNRLSDDDTAFQKGGHFEWPADYFDACKFVNSCYYYDDVEDYIEQEEDNIQSGYRGGGEHLATIRNWTMLDLAASAMCRIVVEASNPTSYITPEKAYGKISKPHMSSVVWENALPALLLFGGPLCNLLARNGWVEPNRQAIRTGFLKWFNCEMEHDRFVKPPLGSEVKGDLPSRESSQDLEEMNQPSNEPRGRAHSNGNSFFEKSSFENFVSVYGASPENAVHCLQVAGIKQPIAQSVVEASFKARSLAPIYDALLGKPSAAWACAASLSGDENDPPLDKRGVGGQSPPLQAICNRLTSKRCISVVDWHLFCPCVSFHADPIAAWESPGRGAYANKRTFCPHS